MEKNMKVHPRSAKKNSAQSPSTPNPKPGQLYRATGTTGAIYLNWAIVMDNKMETIIMGGYIGIIVGRKTRSPKPTLNHPKPFNPNPLVGLSQVLHQPHRAGIWAGLLGLGFRAWGLGFRLWGLGFREQGLES